MHASTIGMGEQSDPQGLVDLRRAAEEDPLNPAAHYGLGNACAALRRYDAAIASFERVIALNPAHAAAHFNRGNACRALGRHGPALDSYDAVIALRPEFANAHYNRGNTLHDLGRHADAVASFDRAIAIQPDHADARKNRATCLAALGLFDAAVAGYDDALALTSDCAFSLLERGHALFELGRHHAAFESYQAALALRPDDAAAFVGCGNVLLDLKQHAAAVECFEAALDCDAACAPAHYNRGNALCEMDDFAGAAQSYDAAWSLDADLPGLCGARLYARMQTCDWRDYDQATGELLERLDRGLAACHPFCCLALSESPQVHKRAAEIWTRRLCRIAEPLPQLPPRAPGGKWRIGYFSPDFRNHPVSRLMAGVFEHHDRDAFEITAFSLGAAPPDEMRRRLEPAFDRFLDVSANGARDIAMLGRELGLDVAVDLGGYTRDCRPAIFAWRAAPIQIGYLGFLGTMGAGFMDYLIADETLVPQGAERHYCEKIIHLPVYQANDGARPTALRRPAREEYGLPREGFVFCCFNTNYKVAPSTFSVWMRILARVPGSVLFLYAASADVEINLRREAHVRGVDPLRLVFGRQLPYAEHLARYRTADLFLDTWPYNAGATASDALWTGLPLLTCRGRTFAGQMGASVLQALQMPDLITATPAEYEDAAVALATDPRRLADVRERLAVRLAAPLLDVASFTAALESAYETVARRHLAGLACEQLRVGSRITAA